MYDEGMVALWSGSRDLTQPNGEEDLFHGDGGDHWPHQHQQPPSSREGNFVCVLGLLSLETALEVKWCVCSLPRPLEEKTEARQLLARFSR